MTCTNKRNQIELNLKKKIWQTDTHIYIDMQKVENWPKSEEENLTDRYTHIYRYAKKEENWVHSKEER